MAVNLSKFNGIPTKKGDAVEQFKKLVKEEKKKPLAKYLVLKKLKKGMYKGNYSTFAYETRPSGAYLKIKEIKKRRSRR